MKKVFSVLTAVMLLFCGCTANSSVNRNTSVNDTSLFSEGEYTFTDCKNNEISLTEYPETVISNDAALSSLWKMSGGEKAEVAEIDSDAKADLIILTDYSENTVYNTKCSCAYFKINSFEDYLYTLKIFTDINSQPSLYEYYGTELQDNVKSIISLCEEHEKITVCLLNGNGDEMGNDNFVYNILNDIAIISDKDNAQKIFVLPCDDSENLPENAVCLPADLFSELPNSRYAEAYNYLADILYNLNED